MTYEMAFLESKLQGRKEVLGEIALKMLRKGMAIDEILEFTELPLERIKKIAAENSIVLKVD